MFSIDDKTVSLSYKMPYQLMVTGELSGISDALSSSKPIINDKDRCFRTGTFRSLKGLKI